jgi:hypothetical protein
MIFIPSENGFKKTALSSSTLSLARVLEETPKTASN